MTSGVSSRIDRYNEYSDVNHQSLSGSTEEENSESTDRAAGTLALHQSLDSFFRNPETKQIHFPEEKLFQRVLNEHNELKGEVVILKLRNLQLEQMIQSLHSLVIRTVSAPSASQFYMPSEPQSFPHGSFSTASHYRPNTFSMASPPLYPSPHHYPSPPRPDSPTDSEMPQYQILGAPIQSQGFIENNSSEDTPPPGFFSPQRTASDEKVNAAKHFLNLKDYLCAGAYVDEAIQIDSKNAIAFALKSKICRLNGDPMGSLSAANKAIEIDSNNLMALLNKALALRTLNYNDAALETSEAALSFKPRSQLALRCKLECQFLLGRYFDSLQTIESTLQYFPHDPVANNIKTLIYQSRPDLRAAGQQ